MQNVAQNVALVWEPAPYEVDWAHRQEEVPIFDPSRGGDPFHPTLRRPDGRIVFISPTLGGADVAPGKMWEEIDEDAGPEVGPNYPRLARRTNRRCDQSLPTAGPLEPLAQLHANPVTTDFMSEARRLASAYGPLGYSERSFTLDYWRATAAELHAYCTVLGRLQGIELSLDRDEWDRYLRQELEREIPQAIEHLPPWHSREARRLIEEARNGAMGMDTFRAKLSDVFWDEFAKETKEFAHPGAYWRKKRSENLPLKPLVSLEVPGQFTVRCGTRGWSFQQLWDDARRGATVVFCVNCGNPMIIARTDHRYCSSSCRSQASRRRSRSASRSSSSQSA